MRQELRRWLRRLHDEIHLTSLFATHDQEEALEVAVRVVLLDRGRVVQDGTPQEFFEKPAGPFVLDFLGSVNIFHGRVQNGRALLGPLSFDYPEHPYAESLPASGYARPWEIDLSRDEAGSEGFRRSFAFAGDLPPSELRALEQEIEARGGSVHPYLNAVTDVLVVGRVQGTESGAHWAREQIRRAAVYRARWGLLLTVSEEELRAAPGDPDDRVAVTRGRRWSPYLRISVCGRSLSTSNLTSLYSGRRPLVHLKRARRRGISPRSRPGAASSDWRTCYSPAAPTLTYALASARTRSSDRNFISLLPPVASALVGK